MALLLFIHVDQCPDYNSWESFVDQFLEKKIKSTFVKCHTCIKKTSSHGRSSSQKVICHLIDKPTTLGCWDTFLVPKLHAIWAENAPTYLKYHGKHQLWPCNIWIGFFLPPLKSGRKAQVRIWRVTVPCSIYDCRQQPKRISGACKNTSLVKASVTTTFPSWQYLTFFTSAIESAESTTPASLLLITVNYNLKPHFILCIFVSAP